MRNGYILRTLQSGLGYLDQFGMCNKVGPIFLKLCLKRKTLKNRPKKKKKNPQKTKAKKQKHENNQDYNNKPVHSWSTNAVGLQQTAIL